ncbi:MED8 [Mytilus edulis]|uniref:Mediator of RNA polymerase II transcription subunit 8 n=1 Tax=Mytilus edulis TaxID=6550 RepID=A0A8S3TSQ6_MYTED|nr:MED8 [Mytilus edulis]
MCFNHEVVPDYLRTKPEPEVEDKVNIVVQKTAAMQADTAQLNSMNKITSNLLDIINSNKEELESEANQKAQMAQTYSSTDTSSMVAAIIFARTKINTTTRFSTSYDSTTTTAATTETTGTKHWKSTKYHKNKHQICSQYTSISKTLICEQKQMMWIRME